MSRSAATEFARVKVAFPDWSIRRVWPGKRVGFTVRRRPVAGGSRPRYHPALAESEHALWRATAAKPALGINPRA